MENEDNNIPNKQEEVIQPTLPGTEEARIDKLLRDYPFIGGIDEESDPEPSNEESEADIEETEQKPKKTDTFIPFPKGQKRDLDNPNYPSADYGRPRNR